MLIKITEEYLQEIDHRLRIIRTFLELDQRQMAKLMKTAQSHIFKIESGRSAPILYQLIKIERIAEEDNYLRESLSWE
jgi:transcriptional regulator with XRE-family HTH domain